MKTESARYYEFGRFRLSVTDRLLMRDGELVSLTPKLVDTLIVLVENNGHVLTKNALIETLWPDTFVEESSLTQNISLLRRALSEHGANDQYIETIPKRGYRFVGEVREVAEANGANGTDSKRPMQEPVSTRLLIEDHLVERNAGHSAASTRIDHNTVGAFDRRKVLFTSLGAFVVLASLSLSFYWVRSSRNDNSLSIPRSVAVLPFNTIGSQSENELAGLGIADAVILKLSRLNHTRVLPTSSVYKYTSRDKDALSVGRELGVDAVLDGTIQRDGDRVRVTAVLIRLSDGKSIWSQKFDDQFTDLFALQDRISEQVVTALGPAINDGVNIRSDTKRPTQNPAAYEAYLTGLYFWNLRSKDNLPKAIHYLEEAVQRDDHFAMAHAVLADAYYLSFQDGYGISSRSDALAKSARAVQRALALDDSIAEAHTVKAGIAFAEDNFDEADMEFRRALELNSSYAPAHLRYGYFLFAKANLEQAVFEMNRAVELDPVSPVSHVALGYLLLMSRDFNGALRENLKVLELQPDQTVARTNLAETYIQARRFNEAQAELDKLDKTDPPVANELIYLYAVSGQAPRALKQLSESQRAAHAVFSSYDLAVIYAALGDRDAAFHHLQSESPGPMLTAMLKFDLRLDPLRSDSRFAELIERPVPEPANEK